MSGFMSLLKLLTSHECWGILEIEIYQMEGTYEKEILLF